MISTLAMTDARAKLLIEKRVITDAEFKQKLLEKAYPASARSDVRHSNYRRVRCSLNKAHGVRARVNVIGFAEGFAAWLGLLATAYAAVLLRRR